MIGSFFTVNDCRWSYVIGFCVVVLFLTGVVFGLWRRFLSDSVITESKYNSKKTAANFTLPAIFAASQPVYAHSALPDSDHIVLIICLPC